MRFYSRHLTIGALAALALGLTAASASAQFSTGRPGRAIPRGQVYVDQRGIDAGFERGYREGLREGETDLRRREVFDFRDERAWQRADEGYRSEYGRREVYQRAFRDGFERGYSEAYRRGGWSANGGYRGDGSYRGSGGYGRHGGVYGRVADPAFDTGYNDGFEKGIEDARDGDRFDPLRHKWYRSGDRGYDRRYGTKERWENIYREGFRAGYERGYQEARQYWR